MEEIIHRLLNLPSPILFCNQHFMVILDLQVNSLWQNQLQY